MKVLLFALMLFCVSVFGYTKIEKLSTQQALEMLELIDNIEKTNNQSLKEQFTKLTDLDYNVIYRQLLYDVLTKNANNTSFFSKMMGLVSFQNVILVCMVCVSIVFVFSLAKDMVLLLGAYAALIFIHLFLNKKFIYTMGYLLSGLTMYFKPIEIENVFLRYLFIFDWLTPLFGCMVFGIVTFMVYDDVVNHDFGIIYGCGETGNYRRSKRKVSSYIEIGSFVTCVFAIVSIYHHNWLIGVLTVMTLFCTFGFVFGSMFGGYYTGFADNDAIVRCLIVSLLLNGFMIGIASEAITGDIVRYAQVFETGVYFWGSFVGSIAMLILSDEHYIIYKKNYSIDIFVGMQIFMALYCLGMMYFGNMLNITSYKSIGGTFLVLWGLDLERTILRKFGSGHLTITSGIIIANLWFIKQLINWYPEYCIF